jgi:hypothetical protein
MQWSARLSRCLVVACVACLVVSGFFVANAPAEDSDSALSLPSPRLLTEGMPDEYVAGSPDESDPFEWWEARDWFQADDSPGRRWVRAEYLAWWMPGAQSPPLITTSTDPSLLGDINAAETTVLFGGERIQRDWNNGFRLRMGKWLDCEQTRGLEASFFMVCPGSQSARAGSLNGSLIVGRPFIDVETGERRAQLVSDDGLGGFVEVRTRSTLLGAEVLYRHSLCCECYCHDTMSKELVKDISFRNKPRICIRPDLLAGFRYLHYSDSVTIREQLLVIDRPDFFQNPGTEFDIVDSFRAYNNFYGLALAVDCSGHWGRWSLAARPQVNLGVLDRLVSIRGKTVITVPEPDASVTEYEGGLLALRSNIGDYRSSQWVVVPELDLQVGYLIRPRLRLLLGYSCLYFPGLARASEQIDPVINPNLIPPVEEPVTGPARPAYPARRSDVWIQGVTAGIEYRW